MKYPEFLARVKSATPPTDFLQRYGLDAEEIETIQRAFNAAPRPSIPLGIVMGSEIEEMVVRHNCSSLEIGGIAFLDLPLHSEHGTIVARYEADPILVLTNGQIAMCDHAALEHQIQCAANSEQFLEALAAFIEIIRDRTIWVGRCAEAIDMCSRLAGGSDYRTFFQSLCGSLSCERDPTA